MVYSTLLAISAGWVTNFLSHAQVSGFMTGAAILIGLSQVRSATPESCPLASYNKAACLQPRRCIGWPPTGLHPSDDLTYKAVSEPARLILHILAA